MKNIPIMNPGLPSVEEYKVIIDDIFDSKMLSNFAKYSKKLEDSVKSSVGFDNILSVSSGDIALVIGISIFDFPPQSKILVPSFTFSSTVNAVVRCGMQPVFVDIDPDTFNICVQDMSEKMDGCVAVMPVHIFGNPSGAQEIYDLAQTNNMKVIADCAHSLGSKYGSKSVGSCEYADVECFSLSGTKLITSGEGGLISLKSDSLLDKATHMRGYGFLTDYNCKMIGVNGKISEMNAGLGYLNMRSLGSFVQRRNDLFAVYRDGFGDFESLQVQKVVDGDICAFKDICVVFNGGQRDEVEASLSYAGVQTKRYFFPVHRMDIYVQMFGTQTLRHTEYLADNSLCLPIFNDMEISDVSYILDVISSTVS